MLDAVPEESLFVVRGEGLRAPCLAGHDSWLLGAQRCEWDAHSQCHMPFKTRGAGELEE